MSQRAPRPWPALWALVLGFFMILVDATIVAVANPAIMHALDADINAVIWVTSAYLLAYVVPLLITGRLGDRFGPKRLYLTGLVVFTLASAWCGFATTIGMLITARVFQGLGAAMLTPQTMTVITRIFPPDRRGTAMGVWGSVAGAAMLVGPLVGGFLVDGLGWEWIFFVNIPVGVIGFVLAWWLVPNLSTNPHKFDLLGVVLSAAGMFLLVFGIQEGESYDWGYIYGPISVWMLIITGVIVLALFVVWQAVNKRGEPLLPLKLFRDRNFSLSNLGITAIGIAISTVTVPLMFYLQLVGGLTPLESALLLIPQAVFSLVLAPVVGRLVDRVNPKYVAMTGVSLQSLGLVAMAVIMQPQVSPLWFLAATSLIGLGNSATWSPMSSTVTRNLPRTDAGAGSGVYNTTRQVGAVLGSALVALIMQARLAVELPSGTAEGITEFQGVLPESLQAGFSNAMAQATLLPAAGFALAGLIVAFWAKPRQTVDWRPVTGSTSAIATMETRADRAGQN